MIAQKIQSTKSVKTALDHSPQFLLALITLLLKKHNIIQVALVEGNLGNSFVKSFESESDG